MAQEKKRGCGYRKVGAMYLCGGFWFVPCDRLPFPLLTCPVCGGGIRVSRGFTEINPLALFGNHLNCKDKNKPCSMCDPKGDPAFIMGVGEKFYSTPTAFMEEATEMGVSKRIPFIPRGMVLGETVVYLAHPKACKVTITHTQQTLPLVPAHMEFQPRFVESEEVQDVMGIFTAFVPQRVEKLVWESEYTGEMDAILRDRNITPVVIKDGDTDHSSGKETDETSPE